MPPLTRGPLPAGVYWRRRIFVLALAASLVFVIANVLGGGSDGESSDVPAAQQAAGQVEASDTVTVPVKEKRDRKRARTPRATLGPTYDPAVLVEPEGNCDPADVRVTPQVEDTDAGDPVTIGLRLQTVESEACYFRIGPDKISVKITDGSTEIWTSRECPDPVPDDSVVVRRIVATVVEMTWTARESDATCSGRRQWVRWGDYTIAAAALGGEPSESTFQLTKPTPETVTMPADPDGEQEGERGGRDERDDQGEQQGDEQGDQQSDEQDDQQDDQQGDDGRDWRSQDAQGDGGDDQPTR